MSTVLPLPSVFFIRRPGLYKSGRTRNALDLQNRFKARLPSAVFLNPPPTLTLISLPPSAMSPSASSSQPSQISAPCPKEESTLQEPRLPSYQEVVGKVDCFRLPSYRESRQPRYHPYTRPCRVKPADEDRTLFHTVYDDERIVLDVPPARGRRGYRPLIPPLVPTPLIAYVDHVRVERQPRQPEDEEVLRRRRVTALILQEFVAAWPHCGVARPA